MTAPVVWSFDEVEAKAEAVIKGVRSAPISLTRIARQLGLRLEPSDDLSDDVSGVLLVRGKGGVVGYNSNHATVRQRFSIAHEFGHFVLHSADRELFIDNAAFFRSDASAATGDYREREANVFAAALLMPRRLLLRSARKLGIGGGVTAAEATDEAVRELAAEFKVSTQAMSYRLMNLGLM